MQDEIYYESPSPIRRFNSGIPSAPSRFSSAAVRLIVGVGWFIVEVLVEIAALFLGLYVDREKKK